MLNLSLQILTILSGLLVNFFIPLLFGLEEYGLFLKANILVFLFHKFTEIISEPLISKIDYEHLLPVTVAVSIFILLIFLSLNFFFSIGNSWLLASMLWSNCVFLLLYALRLHYWVLYKLISYIITFSSLLCLLYFDYLHSSLAAVLAITNVVPSTICFILLIIKKKTVVVYTRLYNYFVNMVTIIPGLFALTLVNNLFTNILPFYLSFVLSPTSLGLFKVQVSIIQSVTAIFPINKKVISTYFVEHKNNYLFINKILLFSLNYFYTIALLGFIFVQFYSTNITLPQVFMLLPPVHITIILERCLLGMGKRKILIAINVITSLLISLGIFFVQQVDQIILLYTLGISLYLLLMLGVLKPFLSKNIVKSIALITPLLVLSAMYSSLLGLTLLSITTTIVFITAPFNKSSIAFTAK